MKMKMLRAILVLLVLVAVATTVLAVPGGPNNITVENSERRTNFSTGVKQIEAQAGNVTQLSINTTILTNRWQGYYGNISGTITLDDADGNTMYDWDGTSGFSPVGEIYAANFTVSDWSDVVCVNLTPGGTSADGPSLLNLSILEDMYGMGGNDSDGIDETFSFNESVTIGTTTLDSCPATYIYQSDSQSTGTWNETLLTENATTTVIFAAEVEQDTIGFDGNLWDFQMIVGENGDVDGTTTYYFYVELA